MFFQLLLMILQIIGLINDLIQLFTEQEPSN